MTKGLRNRSTSRATTKRLERTAVLPTKVKTHHASCLIRITRAQAAQKYIEYRTPKLEVNVEGPGPHGTTLSFFLYFLGKRLS